MTCVLKRSALLISLIAPIFLSACASDVSQSKYDGVVAENEQLQSQNQQLQSHNQQLQSQNQQLQQQAAVDQAHINRLQSAIKYTVNSDLLFPSGGWEISDAGKDVIADMAQVLAAEQQEKLLVNGYTDNASIGPSLEQQGITSNQALSEKRADAVMQYLISQGVKAELVSSQGFGEAHPIAPNSTPQGRAQNRRVEVTLAGI
jgi:chemotaxis protein MotB